MKTIKTLVTLAFWITLSVVANAQETDSQNADINHKILVLNEEKETVIAEEKEALTQAVEEIIDQLNANKISATEAENLKQEAAKKHALNIENRVAIIDNKIALVTRNGHDGDSDSFSIHFGRKSSTTNGISSHHRRTYSTMVVAFGLNNAIIEGQSLNDSPYRIGGSRFFEIGHVWTTRVLKNAGWLRVKYGFSFQFNGLKPEDNKHIVTTSGTPVLEEYPLDLDKSKIRQDNLVIPVHFEFGPAKTKGRDGNTYFSTHKQFKIGLGGYAGLNLNTIQKLKFQENGEDVKQKIKLNSAANNFVYGLSGYIGWDDTSLYVKYDLNPIFKNGPEQRNVSAGVRFDFN